MTTKKMTKTQAKREAEALRVKVIGLMGRIANGQNWALNELWEIANELNKEATASATFGELLDAWPKHKYRPTIRGDINPKFTVFADIYDFFQLRSGYDVTAFRG